ncbi:MULTISPECIES: TIGR03790 family protein [unclassified Lentimonas]|uniref:TIGR03790 family protein n=1 Tax=unclassified Lentimonas TaxID=2630993 RepID=UPI00138A5034|nr:MULTISPECIES: TIGR03790 family protein [unclassified Lentimonas]
MSFRKISLSIVGLMCVGAVALVRLAADEADHVVVLVNTNDSGSADIAKYYTEQRGIPSENIIALDMPTKETVSVREFVDAIYNPLLNALIDKNWMTAVKATGRDIVGRERVSIATHKISYLVTTRGVPLRIANDSTLLEANLGQLPKQFQVNNGSVDGELALLASPANLPMTAFVPNPLFSNIKPTRLDAKRVIRVSRLDGPSVESVTDLIERSMQAEAEGLIGRAYFDIGGPHAKGDEWMNAAGDLAVKAFFDTDFEKTKRAMDGRDRYDAPAIYMGWYRQNAYGPWREAKWSVPPGAIGFHLHSFSGTTVRSTSKGWLGAFVSQGYCATVGNVYEPYLEYTHHPQMLLEALLEGHTFGEAVMFSNPALSWQGVAIGDPLYRPFKVGLDAQLKESMKSPFSAYLCLRQINRLEAEGKTDEALSFARTQLVRQPSLPLAYKLATLYAAAGEDQKAVEALRVVRYITVFSREDVVLVQQIASFLNKHNESGLALDLYKKLIDQQGLEKALRISLLEGGAKIALSQGDAGLSSNWTLTARKLKVPPAKKK